MKLEITGFFLVDMGEGCGRNWPTFHVDNFHPMIYVKKVAQGLVQSIISIFVSSIQHLFQISTAA